MRPQSFLEGIARRLSVVSLRLSGRLQAVEECRDNNRALLWFSLKDQVGSINAGDFDLRLDSSNLFEAGWPNQAVLLGLNEENRYCDLYECWLRVDGQNLVQARCENFRFDRADGRMNSCMK